MRSFTLSGEPREQIVTGVAKPVTLAVDGRNRLWVGDNGPDMQIKIFTPRFGYGAGTAKCPKHAG